MERFNQNIIKNAKKAKKTKKDRAGCDKIKMRKLNRRTAKPCSRSKMGGFCIYYNFQRD